MNTTRIKYTGTALPGNAESITMLDTTTNGMWKGFIQHSCWARVAVDIHNSHSGTLDLYKLEADEVTWEKISTTAVAAASADSSNQYDFWIEPYLGVRIIWVNGATPQTAFDIDMVATSDRSIAT